jgi:hypothetical protein
MALRFSALRCFRHIDDEAQAEGGEGGFHLFHFRGVAQQA